MTCQLPPPLTDDEISAILDGTAGEGVLQHLSLCPACAHRVNEARRLEAALSRQLTRWNCPPAQALGEYHLKLLNGAAAQRIADHVAGCLPCQEELAELAAYLGTRDAEAAPAPGRGRMGGQSRLWHPLQPGVLFGALQTRQPALTLRSAEAEPVVVEAKGVTLFLMLEAGAGHPALLGQLAGDDLGAWAGALVQLWQNGALRTTAEVDDFGAFRCQPLELMPFELALAARGGATLVVPQIDLAV